jgi:ribose 5-phosphate isomerase B
MSNNTSIVIGADHGGFELKQKVVEYLKSKPGVVVEDVGILDLFPVDYPEIAAAVCKSVIDNSMLIVSFQFVRFLIV